MSEMKFVYEQHSLRSDTVEDMNGNLLFKVKYPVFSGIDVLVEDPSSRPVLEVHRKLKFFGSRQWKVFQNTRPQDNPVLCSVKKPFSFHGLSLNVFFASEPGDREPDLKLERETFGSNMKVFRGQVVVAEIKSMSFFKSRYQITVVPGVDHTLVLALLLIARDIERSRNNANRH